LLAPRLRSMRDDWWLIGSAAVALCGAAPVEVADVDLLTSIRDARRLREIWNAPPQAPGPHPLFRSQVHFEWTATPIPVDVMAGFTVNTAEGWRAVCPRSRERHTCVGATFYTPARHELIGILEMIGRPKDRERADLLRALAP